MRGTVFVAVCLSLVAVAWGNNFIIGIHLPGEVVVRDEVIVSRGIFGKPQIALCNGTAPAQHEITFVSVVAWNPWLVSIRPVKGWLGTDSITVVAVGKPFPGFGIRCTILAVPKKTTTVAATTTPASTTPETTTQKTSTTSTPSTTTSTPSTTTSTPSTTTSTPSPTTSTPSTTTSTPSTYYPSTADPSTEDPSTEDPSTTVETTTEPRCTSTPSPAMHNPPWIPNPQPFPIWFRLVEDILSGEGRKI